MSEKSVVIDDLTYKYVVHCDVGEYGTYYSTDFFIEYESVEVNVVLRKLLSQFGIKRDPVIAQRPIVLFSIDSDVESPRYTREEMNKIVTRSFKIHTRAQEIARGELI